MCNYKLIIHKKQISFLETFFALDAMILQKKKQQDKVPTSLGLLFFWKYTFNFSSPVTVIVARLVVTSSNVNFVLPHIIWTWSEEGHMVVVRKLSCHEALKQKSHFSLVSL